MARSTPLLFILLFIVGKTLVLTSWSPAFRPSSSAPDARAHANHSGSADRTLRLAPSASVVSTSKQPYIQRSHGPRGGRWKTGLPWRRRTSKRFGSTVRGGWAQGRENCRRCAGVMRRTATGGYQGKRARGSVGAAKPTRPRYVSNGSCSLDRKTDVRIHRRLDSVLQGENGGRKRMRGNDEVGAERPDDASSDEAERAYAQPAPTKINVEELYKVTRVVCTTERKSVR